MGAPQSVAVNPLKGLQQHGQSLWLDYIHRNLITSGELTRLVEEDGLRGVTSNPAIFEKAINGSSDYTEVLKSLAKERLDAKTIYERMAIKDIQDAADILRSVYERTNKRDGYVSLEVSPHLAQDTSGTLAEATRLWREVGCPNVMIKVPGTVEGIRAVEQLLSEGINVNVTLLFAQERYVQVAEAYLKALEQAAARGGELGSIASVASFFISRIDTMVDNMLAERLKASTNPAEQAMLKGLMGKVAIANGKQAYQLYKQIFSGPRWELLAKKGATTQRVLWASTSTKNPEFRDVLYVEELLGPETVNTLPPATLDAFRDHGQARASLEAGLDEANSTMEALAEIGLSMREVTDKLLEEGVRLFSEPFDKLLDTVRRHCR